MVQVMMKEESKRAASNAHKTAIKRNKISAPAKVLSQQVKCFKDFNYKVLDFGCGHGFDADALGLDKYDPHFFPEKPSRKYMMVMCNYVLNVLTEDMQGKVLREIADCLNTIGVAYITVRRDAAVANGFTKKGTYQRIVELPFPVMHKCSSFVIYVASKQSLDTYNARDLEQLNLIDNNARTKED